MKTGEHRLFTAVQCGDKLLPEIASSGRDVIRQQLASARALWNQLAEAFAEHNRLRESQAEATQAYAEHAAQLNKWLASVQSRAEGQSAVPLDTLEANKEHVRTMKVRISH